MFEIVDVDQFIPRSVSKVMCAGEKAQYVNGYVRCGLGKMSWVKAGWFSIRWRNQPGSASAVIGLPLSLS